MPTPRARDHKRGGKDCLEPALSAGVDWGLFAPAIRRWDALTRPCPPPTELSRNGKPRLSPAFSEWLMGLPAGHVTAVPGLSRNAQLTAIGNGVVPQQGAAALPILLDRLEAGIKGGLRAAAEQLRRSGDEIDDAIAVWFEHVARNHTNQAGHCLHDQTAWPCDVTQNALSLARTVEEAS